MMKFVKERKKERRGLFSNRSKRANNIPEK